MIEERLSEFAQLLRQNGLRVSPAELSDAAAALVHLGLAEREVARAALRSTLVKRGRDASVFDVLFGLYFGGLGQLFEGFEQSLLDQLADEGSFSADSLEMLAYELSARALSPLVRAALEGDVASLSRLLRGAALQVNLGAIENPLQQGFFARRLAAVAGVAGAAEELRQLEGALRERGIDLAGLELVSRRLALALRKLEGAVQKLVQDELHSKRQARQREGGVAGRSWLTLDPAEVARMESAVRRLAERLKARLNHRQRAQRRGALQVRRTLRRNLSQGGIPMHPVFRRKRALRPDLLILCDVSDSVRNVSRLMLLFVYTLQSLFGRVRSFGFVSDIAELGPSFRGQTAAAAIEAALSGKAVSLSANSNYGRALSLFCRDFLGAVSRRTTVIVIGDGRNNHNAANAWALREIRRKAKRLVWICPEAEANWGMGDSEMLLYAKESSRVAVVTSLGELEAAAEALLPG